MITNALTKWVIRGMVWFVPIASWAQSKPGDKTDWVDSIMNVIHTDQHMDSRTKSNLADSVYQVCVKEQDTCNQIYARIVQAKYLDNMSMADSALIQLYWASHAYQLGCDSMTLMALFANLTNVYLSLGEFNRIDSVSRIALALWNPAWKEKELRFAILNNLAIAQASKEDLVTATSTFHQLFHEATIDNNKDCIQKALINLGSIKGMTSDLDSAYYFFNTAAGNAKENSDLDNYMALLINLASLDKERGRYKQAISMLDSTYTLAEESKNTETLAHVQQERADVYSRMHLYEKAYGYIIDFIKLREQYLNEERVKAVTEMMEKYESEKKARQIQQLKIENLDATLVTERVKNTRNRYLYIGIFILLGAIGIWSRLRYIHKSRTAIQKEKDISEGLLLNILPASVADELKKKGYAEAMSYDSATILFSDFKEFTIISENLTPAELVEEINVCFKAFDEIMTRFGIEKIKTIGDAYMAAGGLPDTNSATTLDVVLAGLEMQRMIVARKKEREDQQLTAFDMRIGIHSGPVVAGIVGVKKFQYDIWGDTVNIANRMESNSEIGRVNISDATYQLVKANPNLSFIPRGPIQVKGKGEMAMYFVDLTESTSAV